MCIICKLKYYETMDISTNYNSVNTENLQLFSCVHIKNIPIRFIPMNLITLDISCSSVQYLPDFLPNTLETLVCSECKYLEKLPVTLPLCLKNLNINFCRKLTFLPKLPEILENLHCIGTNISTLPKLPNSLLSLEIDGEISEIPYFPRNLQIFKCACENMIKIPSPPDSLRILDIFNSGIIDIPKLHPNTILTAKYCKMLMRVPKESQSNIYKCDIISHSYVRFEIRKIIKEIREEKQKVWGYISIGMLSPYSPLSLLCGDILDTIKDYYETLCPNSYENRIQELLNVNIRQFEHIMENSHLLDEFDD